MSVLNPINISNSYQAGTASATDRIDASRLDNDHAAIESWINDELIPFLNGLSRDDGTLKDKLVRMRNLHPEVTMAQSGLITLPEVIAATALGVSLALTGTASTFAIDGITGAQIASTASKRVLLWQQNDPNQDGIYVYSVSGSTYTPTKSDDAITGQEIVTCVLGVSNGGLMFRSPSGAGVRWTSLFRLSGDASMIDVLPSEGIGTKRILADHLPSDAMRAIVRQATLAAARAAMDPNQGEWLIKATGGTAARKASDRAGDVALPEDDGAVGDGSTVDTAACQAASVRAAILRGVRDYVTDGLSRGAGTHTTGGIWRISNGVAFNLPSNTTHTSYTNLRVVNTSSADGHAFNMNTAGIYAVLVMGCTLSATGYGVLTNAGATGLSRLRVIGCDISSAADAVELNAPGITQTSMTVMGCVMTATGGTGAGFAVGIARARGVAVVGNSTYSVSQQDYHIEDDQWATTIVGNSAIGSNIFLNAGKGGVGYSGTGQGIVVVGNNAVGSGSVGINFVWDASGSLLGSAVVGNRVSGYTSGIVNGENAACIDANVIHGAMVVLTSQGGGNIHGENLATGGTDGVGTLLKTLQLGCVCGRIDADAKPATIIDSTGNDANALSSWLRGFSFPITGIAIASTYTDIALFSAPALAKGRLVVRLREKSTGHWNHFSADVLWDGTTWTETSPLSGGYGSLGTSTPLFKVVGGIVYVNQLYSASTGRTISAFVSFDGEYVA